VADRVVLHIGTMKSGTTYLQGALAAGTLEDAGAFYAGGTFGVQTAAVRQPARWRRLAEEVAGRPGVAVYSQEFLSFASPKRVPRLVGAFGGTPVEVVLTVRDQHSAIPAQWQSYTRNRGTDSWEAYLREVERGASGDVEEGDGPGRDAGRKAGAARSFHRAQDVPRIVRRWRRQPGVDRVSVVLVPPSGAAPTELWRRFCEAADLEAAPPPTAGGRSNESLGYASCDLLRRLNVHLGPLDKRPYRSARAGVLGALLPLREAEGRPALDRDGVRLADRLNDRIVGTSSRPGVRLVGSLAELQHGDPAAAPAEVDPPAEDQLRRALAAVAERCLPGAAAPDLPPDRPVDELVDDVGRRLAARSGR
jgi:hypothetical protein